MKYKSFWLKTGMVILLLLVIIAVGILGDIYFKQPQETETAPLSPVNTAQTSYVGKDTPVVQEIYYRQCRHLIRQTLIGDEKFAEKSFSELRGEGWNISWSEKGELIAFTEKDGLCPDDAEKRHLGIYEGEVAIYEGPSGASGEMLEVLGIKIESLYPQWQEMLQNGGIDFDSNDDLLNALENLDEF